MRNLKGKYLLILIIISCRISTAFSQHVPEGVTMQNLFAGYIEKINGEIAGFHSSDPNANDALISRNAAKNNKISWKTQSIPANFKGKYVYYVWLTGLATGKNRQNSSFKLSVNGQRIFDIAVKAHELPQNWNLRSKNGAELYFNQHWADENGDCFGYTYLKIPIADYRRNQPLTLEVTGNNGDRYDDWYMVFQRPVKQEIKVIPRLLLRDHNKHLQQLVSVQINNILPITIHAGIKDNNGSVLQATIKPGYNEIEFWVPAVRKQRQATISVKAPGIMPNSQTVALQPVQRRSLYLVNHSHNDIGYSDLQTVVAEKQNNYIREAMQLIEKTRNYPKDARFIWNIEAMWAVENFMEQASADEKSKLIAYAKAGSIGLPAGYANLLTGICRPEELIHLTDYSDSLNRQYGIKSNTLMISDVPGMSWNIVSALRQRGVKYVSSGPNFIPHDGFPDDGGRVGATHRLWGDKPFYWVSASGADTILYWQAGTGYSWFQDWNMGRLRFSHKPFNQLMNYMQKLQDNHYPYDMVQIRYAIINDNSKPDEGIADFVTAWNKKYVSPKLAITNVEDLMEKFEKKYAKTIPVQSGDFTPYWEDGAMSTAREEVLTKRSVERLYQAEVVNSLFFPGKYNTDRFYKAWRNAILWHEHTWGAWNSIAAPNDPNVIKQWDYKRAFAEHADSLSKLLLAQNLTALASQKEGFKVINTSSWDRTDMVVLSRQQSTEGDVIIDETGTAYPSQRLKNGSLAFLAKNVPALGFKKFYIKKGISAYTSNLSANGYTIKNQDISLTLDEATGAIKNLLNNKTGQNLVKGDKYKGLNQYLYMPGLDPSKAVSVKDVKIKVVDNGPLVSSFEIEANAPGLKSLKQEIRLINEINKIEIVNTVDKENINEKESVHFAFPINVAGGQISLDMGTGILKPGINQLAGANKDYLSMQRWVDVSNNTGGLTFITNDVPLIEEGELISEMPAASSTSFGAVSVEKKWKEKTTPSTTFFSYAMNNYWYTNYKSSQEGKVTFRYAMYLHNAFDPSAANRLGTADAQPLLITGDENEKVGALPFKLNDQHILLTSVKPAKTGKGLILRFYNSSSTPKAIHLNWAIGNKMYSKIFLSNASEEKLRAFQLTEMWPAFAIKTLYIE